MSRSLSSLTLFALTIGCEDVSPSDAPVADPRTPAETVELPHELVQSIDEAQELHQQRVNPPSRELFCSTAAFAQEDGLARTLRYHVESWEDGRARMTVEDGFAHPELAASLGHESVQTVYSDTQIDWRDGSVDIRWYDDDGTSEYMWLGGWGEGYEGIWDGFMSVMLWDFEDIEDPLTGEAPADDIEIARCGGAWIQCWEPDHSVPFQYDPDSGLCTNEAGESGLNPFYLPMVRDTQNGECADLRWQDLSEGEVMGAQLEGWDLRGASLESAVLTSTDLVDARLEGADLETLDLEDAQVEGTVDDFTLLPEQGCDIDGDDLSCEL